MPPPWGVTRHTGAAAAHAIAVQEAEPSAAADWKRRTADFVRSETGAAQAATSAHVGGRL